MSRILVIDDDRSVRHLIAKAFEDTDVQVVPAATAEEGMHLLGEAQSDVVLLDILLPESSGLELFERIRTVDPKLPVIFITSLSSSDRTWSENDGANLNASITRPTRGVVKCISAMRNRL